MTQETVSLPDTATIRRRLQHDAQKNAHKRQFSRHETFVISRMVMMGTSQGVDGVINEISVGGLRFRPAATFLQRRDGEAVSILVGKSSYSGRIRSSRPDGYGIQLLDKLSEEQLGEILAQAAN